LFKEEETSEGLDFYYANRSHALKFVDFLTAVVPIRYKTSEKLISHDDHNNSYNYKYTFSVEILPVCRDDLACLGSKVAASCGNINPLCLCFKVSNQLHIVDPFTLQVAEISPNVYWANATSPFRAIAGFKQLIEYVVIDIVPVGPVNGKFVLSDVTVARAKDFGVNDIVYAGRTHLGHILKPGDYALGYDILTSNFNDADLTALRNRQLPDFILIRKHYQDRRSKHKRRHWKLKMLDKEVEEDNRKKQDPEKLHQEMEGFLQDLEEDPELRAQVNLFKEPDAEQIVSHYTNDMVDEEPDFPEIGLEELIEDMSLTDKN